MVGLTAVTAVGAHTAWAVQKYGLSQALTKSLLRKGSFTSPLDPRRWWAGIVHFYAIWGEEQDKQQGGPSAGERMRNWHGWYWETTGDVHCDADTNSSKSRLLGGDATENLAALPSMEELPIISLQELVRHTSKDSLWVVIDGFVLDVTEWLVRHPGGTDVLLRRGGGDVTAEFRGMGHSPKAVAVARTCVIGRLVKASL